MDLTSTLRTEATDITHSDEQPAPNGSSSEKNLAQLYGAILPELARVEARLHSELQSPYESLVPVLRHGTQLGGKRLRPAMLLLAGASIDDINDDHIVMGAVIEMIHTATLIHDDVLDEATTRRHVPTINARWNSHTSILLGDFLFSQSFRMAAELDSTLACRWVGEAARKVCEGELRQVLDRNQLDLEEETYIDILRGKTAELCQVACKLGAKFSGGSGAQIDALGDYGDAVGIAFQIADDFLDLWGDPEVVGKTLGTDIEQGKITLPIIRVLQTADGNRRNEIVSILTGPPENRVHRIRPYLNQSDAKEYTAAAAERYRERAISSIDSLSPSPAKDYLQKIADFAVRRRF